MTHTLLNLVLVAMVSLHVQAEHVQHVQHVQSEKICLPDQCEFTLRSTEIYESDGTNDRVLSAVGKVSYDKTGDRIAYNYSEPWPILAIQLFKEHLGISYNITSKECEVYNATDFDEYCIPDGAKRMDTYFIDKGQTEYVTDYKKDYSDGSEIFGFIQGKVIVPLFDVGLYADDSTFLQFQNFTVGIRDPSVFDIPKACKTAKLALSPKLGKLRNRPFGSWWH